MIGKPRPWYTALQSPGESGACGVVGVQNHSLDGHSPKSAFALWQVRINNCIFYQFSLVLLIIPRPTPTVIRHGVLALAREGMRQCAIVGLMGLTRNTVNRILWRHAPTGTLVPGKSTGLIGRTQGAVSIRKTVLPGMAIPMLKIRRPNGRLIFNMEIAIRR